MSKEWKSTRKKPQPASESKEPKPQPRHPSDKYAEAKVISTGLIGHPFYNNWKLVLLEAAYSQGVSETERSGAYKLLSAIEALAQIPDDVDERDPDLYPQD